MTVLKDGERIISNQDELATHTLDYFTNLFATPNELNPNILIQNVIPHMVLHKENTDLISLPSDEEIRSAVFSLNGDGAPGPDGFGGNFYQNYWSIVSKDVSASAQQFFAQSWLLPNMNSNNVILIPKSSNADKIEDFRPIALANYHFKIITKVLADRLSHIASRIISPEQKGFIRDRSIAECICTASEAINLLEHKSFGGNLAIKLDVRKAFDTMDWEFLLQTLQAFGFHDKFINWVNIILHSARLSINVNGQNVGFFKCSRGVRQGDPLSPLLFCLAEDVLSRGITSLVVSKKLSTISGPNGIATPSHVLYADDILIFCKGAKRDLLHLRQLLDDYGQASGQIINPSKCKFYSNATPRKAANISSYLGFNAGSLPFTYLGVPLFKGKPRKIHLQPIADRILGKLAKWKGHSLSIMDRVELVKSVVTRIKLNWHATIRNSIWVIASGKNISFWKDNWLGTPLVDLLSIPQNLQGLLKANISDYIQNSTWSIPKVLVDHSNSLIDKIAAIDFSGGKDLLCWEKSSDGMLTLKLAYNSLAPASNNQIWFSKIWSKAIPPSQSFITWRLINSKMPCDDNLQRRGYNMVSICNLCIAHSKTSSHLFFSCPLTIHIWNWINGIFNLTLDISSIKPILQAAKNYWSDQVKDLFMACIIHAIGTIWWCRKQMRFENKHQSLGYVINRIRMATSLSGISSKVIGKPSLNDLCIIKYFKTTIILPKAPSILEVVWYPPMRHRIKINSDGAARAYPGPVGGGAIFRDNSGQCLACTTNFYGIQEAIFAGLKAAISAIHFAKSKGWMTRWLECDSSLVVDIFKGKHNPPWKLLNNWIKCKATMEDMDCMVSHIYRECKSCADKLANYGINSKTSSCWNSTPTFIAIDCFRNRNQLPSYRFTT
ncbi:PREDICTED: uncharacterized protein LOC109338761 [Lupinus angustifolius]|uniref:uncharacterized protein LOC109338761 n=1 Tax=Lupinus angustifolius TaxID=3871 RepID=UPI00092EBEE3|nr:PREDICTED: uncharacterized protein LOC109338761 [Lupinus angustifolius]